MALLFLELLRLRQRLVAVAVAAPPPFPSRDRPICGDMRQLYGPVFVDQVCGFTIRLLLHLPEFVFDRGKAQCIRHWG